MDLLFQEMLHLQQEEFLKDRQEAEMEMSDSEEGDGSGAPSSKKYKRSEETCKCIIMLIIGMTFIKKYTNSKEIVQKEMQGSA